MRPIGKYLGLLVLGSLVTPAFAQFYGYQNHPVFKVRRTNAWSETRRDGECVIRVIIDNEADVELRWDQIRIRTLAGQPGRDDGSECNAPLQPGGISDLQFQGIDGRGEVRLIEQPGAANDWAAIVRIRDRPGGAEGYTYRLRWQWNGTTKGRVTESSGGGFSGVRSQAYNPRQICRQALAARLRNEWGARIVAFAPKDDSQALYDGRWSYGGTANLEGRADVRAGNERRQIQFVCVVNSYDNQAEQVYYNFVDSEFTWKPKLSGSNTPPAGADPAFEVIAACQNEIRNRVVARHGAGTVSFRDITRKWWEGETQRVNGRASVSIEGQSATIEYNCTSNGPRIDWGDYRIVAGSLRDQQD